MDGARWDPEHDPGTGTRLAGLVAVVVILALLVTARSVAAQATRLAEGDTVRITYYGQTAVCRFLWLRGDTLAVRSRDGVRLELPESAIELTEVPVGRTPRGHQIGHDAAIGTGVGLLVGLLVAVARAERPGPGDCTAFCGLGDLTEETDVWAWSILVGAGAGAVVGAIRPRAIIWQPLGSLGGWPASLRLQASVAPYTGGPMVSIGLRI